MNKSRKKTSFEMYFFVSLYIIFGIFALYAAGIDEVSSFNDLLDYLRDNIAVVVVSVAFILLGVYSLFYYVISDFCKPKIEILYLYLIEDEKCTFVDKKGRKYIFYNRNDYIFIENKFYEVVLTSFVIQEVVEESQNLFPIPKIKESYWEDFYSPIGNFENIAFLPVVYLIFIAFSLNLLFSKQFWNIPLLVVCLSAFYLIIYDLIYKIKKRNRHYTSEEVDDSNLKKSYEWFKNIIKIINILPVIIVLLIFFSMVKDIFIKIILGITIFFVISISIVTISGFWKK